MRRLWRGGQLTATVRSLGLQCQTTKAVRGMTHIISLSCFYCLLVVLFTVDLKMLLFSPPEATDTLIDLAGLDTPSPPQPVVPPSQPLNPDSAFPSPFPIPVLPPPPKRPAGSHDSQSSSPSHAALSKASASLSLLDDELLSLGGTAHFTYFMSDSGSIVRPRRTQLQTYNT